MLNAVKIKESIYRISAIIWSSLVKLLYLSNGTIVKANLLESAMYALLAITKYDLVKFV